MYQHFTCFPCFKNILYLLHSSIRFCRRFTVAGSRHSRSLALHCWPRGQLHIVFIAMIRLIFCSCQRLNIQNRSRALVGPSLRHVAMETRLLGPLCGATYGCWKLPNDLVRESPRFAPWDTGRSPCRGGADRKYCDDAR